MPFCFHAFELGKHTEGLSSTLEEPKQSLGTGKIFDTIATVTAKIFFL